MGGSEWFGVVREPPDISVSKLVGAWRLDSEAQTPEATLAAILRFQSPKSVNAASKAGRTKLYGATGLRRADPARDETPPSSFPKRF